MLRESTDVQQFMEKAKELREQRQKEFREAVDDLEMSDLARLYLYKRLANKMGKTVPKQIASLEKLLSLNKIGGLKRSLTGYGFFCSKMINMPVEEFKRLYGAVDSVQERVKIAGRKWKLLSPEEKKVEGVSRSFINVAEI
jgi:hypothetical protein